MELIDKLKRKYGHREDIAVLFKDPEGKYYVDTADGQTHYALAYLTGHYAEYRGAEERYQQFVGKVVELSYATCGRHRIENGCKVGDRDKGCTAFADGKCAVVHVRLFYDQECKIQTPNIYPLRDLESSLPALAGTPAEMIATCAITRILSGHSCMFTVSNVELGLIARAMNVTPVVFDGVHSITVEDGGAGVVFQWVQKG